MANIGENTFFVYDTSINKKEEDDPQDAIVYFRPDNVSIDQQCMLSGQLVGAISFIGSISKSRPSVITMKNVKFAIAYEGVYIIALAGSLKLRNKTLKTRLAALYRLFVLFHGSITKIQQESLNRDFFLCAMKDIWSCYLSFIHRHGNSVLSLFESIPTLNIPKSMGSIFLRSCHILQNCRRHHGVLSGCILYKNRILCNEFPTQLVSSLLIKAVKKYGHMSFLAADTDFPLPRGISIIPIYLRPDEFETISLKKLEVPLTSQQPASTSQQSPSTSQQSPSTSQLQSDSISQQSVSTSQRSPSTSQQLPSPSQQLTSTSQQLPSTSQQSSSTSQQLTSTNQQLTSTSQQLPSAIQQLTLTSQQSDSTSQQSDSTSKQSPSTSQQLPSTSQQLSSPSQQLSSPSQQSLSTSQHLPSPSQQLPSPSQTPTSQQSDSTGQQSDSTSQHLDSPSQHLDSPSQQSDSTSKQSPSTSQQLPSTSQQLSSSSQQLSSPSQQSPSTSQQLPSTCQQSPSTSQQSPSTSQHLDSTSQHLDSTSQQLDSLGQQLDSTSQQPDSFSQQSGEHPPCLSELSVSSNISTDKIPTSVKDSECIHPFTNDQNTIQNENVQFDKVGIQHRTLSNIETNKSEGKVESINSNHSDDCCKYSTECVTAMGNNGGTLDLITSEQETIEKDVSCIQNGFNHENFVRTEKVNYIEKKEKKGCSSITLKKRSSSVASDQDLDTNCKVTTDIPNLQTLKIANQELKTLPTSNRDQEFVSSNKTPLLQSKDHDFTSSSERNKYVALDASENLASKDKNCVDLDQSDGQGFKPSAKYNSVVKHSSGMEKEQKCISGERESDSEADADSFEPCYEQRESSMVSNTQRELKKCSLYVQAHSEMVVLIIMDYKLRDDAHVINKLWKMVLPVLGELEAELNEVPVPDTPLTMDETKNYRFLKVNQQDQKLESLNYKVTNQASSVQLINHVFTENPSITDLTLRSSESVIYGHKIGTLQTYIEPISMIWPIKGIPSPKDKDFCLEQKTRKRLHCEPNINVV